MISASQIAAAITVPSVIYDGVPTGCDVDGGRKTSNGIDIDSSMGLKGE